MLVPEIVAAGGGLLFAFDHSTIAGKIVLTLLAVVSIFSWSIMITKLRVIRFARRQNARFLAAFHVLITTGVPLCVAIPAMFDYNVRVTSSRGIIVEMGNFAAELASEFEHKYVDHCARESTFRR